MVALSWTLCDFKSRDIIAISNGCDCDFVIGASTMLLLNGLNKDKEVIVSLFKMWRLGLRPLETPGFSRAKPLHSLIFNYFQHP